MKVADREYDLIEHTSCISLRETNPLLADLGENLKQVAMGQKFKRDVIVLVILTEIQNSHNVRMRDLLHDLQLLFHKIYVSLLPRKLVLLDDFEGDMAV